MVRPARPHEAFDLTALTLRSKAHWGYDAAFLAAVQTELTVSPSMLDGVHAYVAERDGALLGWYRIVGEPPHGELSDLFVDPPAIGTGIGGLLLRHARATAAALGFVSLGLDADPSAEPFYRHAGAKPAGRSPSGSVPGRTLPRLVLDLTGDADEPVT